MTNAQVRAELKRIAASFRRHERASWKAAKKERANDRQLSASSYEGEASALKYCADHVAAVVGRMVNRRTNERTADDGR